MSKPLASAAGPAAAQPVTKQRTIKQDEVQAVLSQRLIVETQKRELKKAEEALLTAELALIGRKQAGANIERGDLTIAVETTNGRKQTAWKELFATACGPEGVEAEMGKTRELNARPENQKTMLVVLNKGVVEKTA